MNRERMPVSPSPSILRKVLEDQFSLLAAELVALFEQELTAREVDNRRLVRDDLAETLNSAVRLLRNANDFTEIWAVLADSSATCCNSLAVFSIDGGTMRVEQVRGTAPEVKDKLGALELPVGEAAAIAGAIESGDPVVAMTTPREVSGTLAEIFEHKPEDRAYILPIAVRRKTIGVV